MEFITNALNGLKELWDKLTGWVTGLFSRGWSNLESFFAGVPGLTGATSGLSQVTGLFGAAGLSASSGLAHADSLASSASLPALAGIGGGSGFGGLPSLAQVHAASTRQALRPRADGPVGAAAEQVGGQSQLVSAQGSQGMGGPVGMGGMHPSSGASKGRRRRSTRKARRRALKTPSARQSKLTRAVGKRCWYETSSNGMASQIHC